MRLLPLVTRRLLTRFRAARRGAAAVEFALILPIMLLVYIGSIEASNLITTDRKVQNVSGSVGDLVARTDGDLLAATLLDYVRMAGGVMTPFDPTPLTQIVTEVLVSADGTTATVVWSRGYKGQALVTTLGYAANSTHALPGTMLPAAMVAMAKNQYVIISEARYTYAPFYGFGLNSNIPLSRQNYYLPRFGKKITLK